ncbi:Hsp20 family protein [Gammaproteobacteria bacterium]|nr:Hsp20 family protein [Gammaproteobacteria bacterium]
MRTIDLSPLYRSAIGFDRLASLMESATSANAASSYPPYNIERLSDDDYRITMAIAGFTADDVDITSEQNTLVVRGNIEGDPQSGGEFLYRGIAERNFERRFQLAEHVKVTGARLENGLLHVELAREIPEAMKPRRIAIERANERLLETTDEKKAA